MDSLARLALGTIGNGTDATALVWGLCELLGRHGVGVQCFHSRAAFAGPHGGCPGGVRPRHLDSWLMDADTCREIFAHGTPRGGLGLVEGTFSRPRENAANGHRQDQNSVVGLGLGGDLETLCQWLDLPRLVVLDASRLDDCRLPSLPPRADALLLDRVADIDDAARLETRLHALWGVPVLGSLQRMPAARAAIVAVPAGSFPPAGLRSALASNLEQSLRLCELRRLAARRPWVEPPCRLFGVVDDARPLCIAVAHDEVFNAYFQETLDVLELRGARLEMFSPLHDATLPLDADVVYFGCGHPERFAAALAENTCLMLSLRQHVCGGKRIYGEGGGMAYLCQEIELADGSRYPMVGALPAVARFHDQSAPPEPVEITLARGNWLGEGWSRIRGYRNSSWELLPTERLARYAAEPGHELDLVGRHHALGSRIHINFAAQLDYLQSFFEPHAPALDVVLS